MNKFIYGVVGVALLALLFFGVLYVKNTFFAPAQSPSGSNQPVSQFPTSNNTTSVSTPVGTSSEPGASAGTITLAARGGTMTVRDFIHNGVTIQDVVNPGMYYLSGTLGYCLANGQCPSAAPSEDFSIRYSEKYQFFGVVLQKEPIGTARQEAEVFLANALGVTRAQLCYLNYDVGVTVHVSLAYSGKNLGFSLCPGATMLP